MGKVNILLHWHIMTHRRSKERIMSTAFTAGDKTAGRQQDMRSVPGAMPPEERKTAEYLVGTFAAYLVGTFAAE